MSKHYDHEDFKSTFKATGAWEFETRDIGEFGLLVIRKAEDLFPDLSYLGETSKVKSFGCIDLQKGEHVGPGKPLATGLRTCDAYMPFFRPEPRQPGKDWKHVSKEDKAKVIAQYGSIKKADEHYQRENYERWATYGDSWLMCYMGCEFYWAGVLVAEDSCGGIDDCYMNHKDSHFVAEFVVECNRDLDQKLAKAAQRSMEEYYDLTHIDIADLKDELAESVEI